MKMSNIQNMKGLKSNYFNLANLFFHLFRKEITIYLLFVYNPGITFIYFILFLFNRQLRLSSQNIHNNE